MEKLITKAEAEKMARVNNPDIRCLNGLIKKMNEDIEKATKTGRKYAQVYLTSKIQMDNKIGFKALLQAGGYQPEEENGGTKISIKIID